jgi:AcrR family transcriptional regulator
VARTVGSSAPDTRRRILDSAAEVFVEHGYSGSSMRDIAERLGITKAALYYHFTSKEDLLDGLVQPVMQALADFAGEVESGTYSTPDILREFLDLTVAGIPAVLPLLVDPGAREAIKTRYDLTALGRRIETAVAGSSDPDRLLRSQFVLGGIRALVLSRVVNAVRSTCELGAQQTLRGMLAERVGRAHDPVLSESECEVVVRSAMAGLGGGVGE